jgi:hypothetical protein
MNDMIALLYHTIHPEVEASKPTSYQDVYPLFKFHNLEPFLYHAYQKGSLITPKNNALEKAFQMAIIKRYQKEI